MLQSSSRCFRNSISTNPLLRSTFLRTNHDVNLSISRSFSNSQSQSQPRSQPSIPPTLPSITTPKEFLSSISRPPRRDLTKNSSIVSAVGEDWSKMFELKRDDLKQAGVGIKDRRYLLWALEKFRQGLDPKEYAIEPKPKKKVRGWGPRVQNGIRVSGKLRPGEKRA